jgi:tRNA A-37 threonylcarbamoyl transferase component Bud32
VTTLEREGVGWELQPDFAPLLEALLESPGETVKESPVKRVTRHRAGGKIFYVKRYLHGAVPLRPLKFFFKATQARREWELAGQLEARQIPVVRHVALGERRTWRGVLESVLVTEGFDGAPVDQCRWIDPVAVLKFVERMHERGVVQEDLHLENLLARKSPFELRLVDLHGTRIKAELTRADRVRNLALLRTYLPVPVTGEVAHLSRQIRRRKLFERSKRCLRHNREFIRVRAGGLNWQVREPFRSAAVDGILSDPDKLLQTRATILKPGRSATVGRADGLVLKRFNFRKVGSLFKDVLRSSRARRAFRKGYHLELAGVPTARTIATADRRRGGFLLRSYLLMEAIAGAGDLGACLRTGGTLEPALIRQAARLIGKLHDEGFSHRDLKESNLVLGADEQLFLIDLDGLKFDLDLPASRAAADLIRLAQAAAKFPAVTARQRRLFLRAYCRARRLKTVPRP